jgi:hypothetical protein
MPHASQSMEETMDTSIVTALAALMGSLIGGFTSFGSTWLTQRHASRSKWLRNEIAGRESLYSDFIEEAAQRLADAVEHNISNPTQIVHFLALYNRIRFVGSDEVSDAAQKLMDVTIMLYRAPNVTLHDILQSDQTRDEAGALTMFSGACRLELQNLKRGIA